MIKFHSGLSFRRKTAELCLLSMVAVYGLSPGTVAAQAARSGRDFPFSYTKAVNCVGIMRATAPQSRPATSQHMVWTLAMAAGELGRRLGKEPSKVEEEVSAAERKARKLKPSALRVRTKECQQVAAAQSVRRDRARRT